MPASALFALVAAAPVPAQTQGPDAKVEVLEKVDPYTKGEKEALEKAGYVSLGPFEWCEGMRTDDVQETLGAGTVLWIETAHFKLGSTLVSYSFNNDRLEQKALEGEFARLKTKLARWQPPHNKLDPWMRAHLYAQRLEDVYAEFTAEFGFAPVVGGKKGPAAAAEKSADPSGLEPPQKFRVLLLDKTSSLGRYFKSAADREAKPFDRFPLAGGSMFLGVSEEGLRQQGYDLDAAMHCVIASEATRNFVDGFCNSWFTCPVWLEYGLAHVAARRVDERFTPTAVAKGRVAEVDDWKWEPRVKGLVQNNAAPSWTDMLGWGKWEDMKAQSHLVAWSRVAWLLKRKPSELKVFLVGMVRPPGDRPEEDHSRIGKEQQAAAAKAAFGKTFEELDAQWKKSVVR